MGDQFTHKANEALSAARDLAAQLNHAHTAPIHVALVLLNHSDGALFRAVQAGPLHEAGATGLKRVLEQKLQLVAASHSPSEAPSPSPALAHVLKLAEAGKRLNESHVSVDVLASALLEDGEVAEAVKEAGLNAADINLALQTTTTQ